VLALQGDVREHLRAFAGCGARVLAVRRPDEVDTVDALAIPGGESTTINKLAVEFPAYGSCAGMIMLSTEILDGRPDQRGLGGIEMTVRRNAFGRQVESFEAPVSLDGVPGGPFHAVFIRAPWVERVGPSVRVLGQVDAGSGTGRIVAVRQGHLLATAFHPELTGDLRVHRYFVEMVYKAMGADTTEE
jgi:5'-phosphate synthase pdxT subunit